MTFLVNCKLAPTKYPISLMKMTKITNGEGNPNKLKVYSKKKTNSRVDNKNLKRGYYLSTQVGKNQSICLLTLIVA